MRIARLAMLLVAVSWFTADPACAESRWSLKKLLPSFGKKDDTPRGLYPESNEPSMWQKMNTGTKAFFAKTKEAIPPWLMPETQERVRQSGNSVVSSGERFREEAKTARRNFFAPWAQSKEPERPTDVSDWLGQPRPE